MYRLGLIALLMWSSSALAADSGRGGIAFRQACSGCHTAVQAKSGVARPPLRPARALPHMGPDLAVLLHQRGAPVLRRWVKNPWALRRDTGCDPRLLPASELDNLVSFLSSRTRLEPIRQRRVAAFRRQP
jgi:hypothetical protein